MFRTKPQRKALRDLHVVDADALALGARQVQYDLAVIAEAQRPDGQASAYDFNELRDGLQTAHNRAVASWLKYNTTPEDVK